MGSETSLQKEIQRHYLILTFFNTLSGSFIWGINTLFLLDAGLTKTEAFAANAFFTAGMVLCDIPTGVLADTLGRRISYLLGSGTLIISTLFYFALWKLHSPFWAWAIVSMLLGLGFTFFSGATDAWLVDALQYLKFEGALEDIFARAQIVSGIAMLGGATLGGVIAQNTNLGVPYLVRSACLLISMSVAAALMRDLGFTPRKIHKIGEEVKAVIKTSIDGGIRVPAVRWVMFISPIMSGVGIYAFYAAQPRLLELYGNSNNYSIAGIAASLVAASQIVGGLSVFHLRKFFRRRTSLFVLVIMGSTIFLGAFGLVKNFWSGLICLSLWGLLAAAMAPLRQSYLNKCIKSEGRATILSFDSTLGSTGGVFIQPLLGKTADVWSFATSFMIGSLLQLLALPFVWLARRENNEADRL